MNSAAFPYQKQRRRVLGSKMAYVEVGEGNPIDRDQVEHEAALREVFARFLPRATFRILIGIVHLSPLEAPDALVDTCGGLLDEL